MKKYILILSSIFSLPIFAAPQSELAKQRKLHTALLKATLSRNDSEIINLLDQGAQPVLKGFSETALHYAVRYHCNPKILEQIINAASSDIVNQKNNNGETPLRLAILRTQDSNTLNRMQTIMYLLLNGADIELVKSNKRLINPYATVTVQDFIEKSPERPFLEKLCQFIKSETPNSQNPNIVEAVKTIALEKFYKFIQSTSSDSQDPNIAEYFTTIVFQDPESIKPETLKSFAIEYVDEIYSAYTKLAKSYNAV